MSWSEAYEGGFSVGTEKPSEIVLIGLDELEPGHLVDLGCGQGRNAIYAAKKGHTVDAVDTEYLLSELGHEDARRITFHQIPVQRFCMGEDRYDGTIMTRLFQYMPFDDVEVLLRRTWFSLKDGWMAMINYGASGGVPGEAIGVQKFEHDIGDFTSLLEELGYAASYLQQGDDVTLCMDSEYPIEAYDILAERL